MINVFQGYKVYSREKPEDAEVIMKKLELFMEVLQHIRSEYVDADEIDIDELFDNAIKGMAYTLDPFSEYMTPSEFKSFENDSNDTFGGIGVKVQMLDGYLTVSSTMNGTPAAAAGILAGDKIIAIDGEDQTGKNTDDVIAKLRGDIGSKITLTIKRPETPAPIEITLERAEIANISVSDAHVIEGTSTGYLRVELFATPTVEQFDAALKELEVQNIDSLIIDLRNNPGGQLETCVEMLGRLLPPKSLVATLEGRSSEYNMEYFTSASVPYHFPDKIPIAVLGNRGTASAAEITISCLRDYHRAVFIGERTFGKALVQSVEPLGGSHALKLTTARYFTKLHTQIQGRGIKPDIQSHLRRRDYIAINMAKDINAADKIDPNVRAALKFFEDGAEWPVFTGKEESDYDDILPQWQKDENHRYKVYDYNIYHDLEEGSEAEGQENDSDEQSKNKENE
ncbi:MAG: S41 family peptidase [Lentisphaeria bacterium]|nr:S41 family peptidase [Lentisphaeria bacterium]